MQVQVADSAEVVEHQLPDQVVALALEVLVREEMTGAYHEQFPWKLHDIRLM